MAEGLILEFDGFGLETYEAVNRLLGIDMETGAGDWPSGLLFHSGGAKDGGWVVFEVWDSREDQGRFMSDRLGPALKDGGVTDPPNRMEWIDLAAYHTPE
ncbi:MAG: hypothetical protein JSU06_12095 [Actinobacteria bacterium]|nr:hypothetical protein [Actinomycetota bacterium]